MSEFVLLSGADRPTRSGVSADEVTAIWAACPPRRQWLWPAPRHSLHLIVESIARRSTMRTRRFTEEQIIGILKDHEGGTKAEELCGRRGVSGTTFYKWKAKFGGLEVSEARRLRALEDANRRLKKLLAEHMLDNAALKDPVGKNF
jgi:putative transposase